MLKIGRCVPGIKNKVNKGYKVKHSSFLIFLVQELKLYGLIISGDSAIPFEPKHQRQ